MVGGTAILSGKPIDSDGEWQARRLVEASHLIGAPGLGSGEGGHPDLFRFVPIFPSDLFRFVFSISSGLF